MGKSIHCVFSNLRFFFSTLFFLLKRMCFYNKKAELNFWYIFTSIRTIFRTESCMKQHFFLYSPPKSKDVQSYTCKYPIIRWIMIWLISISGAIHYPLLFSLDHWLRQSRLIECAGLIGKRHSCHSVFDSKK